MSSRLLTQAWPVRGGRECSAWTSCSAKYSQNAAFEPLLDLLASRVRCGQVHDVNVQGFTIPRRIEGDAAWRCIDQHRQEQDLCIRRDTEWDGDDARLHVVSRTGDIESQPQVRLDQF